MIYLAYHFLSHLYVLWYLQNEKKTQSKNNQIDMYLHTHTAKHIYLFIMYLCLHHGKNGNKNLSSTLNK